MVTTEKQKREAESFYTERLIYLIIAGRITWLGALLLYSTTQEFTETQKILMYSAGLVTLIKY